jgi:hypothetical protein
MRTVADRRAPFYSWNLNPFYLILCEESDQKIGNSILGPVGNVVQLAQRTYCRTWKFAAKNSFSTR